MSEKQNLNQEQQQESKTKMALDDAARVKVLSPTRLVFKRFIRNKLAIFGICILTLLFLFCFIGPLLYPYEETEVFYGWRDQNGDYAYAQIRTEYVTYWNPNCDEAFKKELNKVSRLANSAIIEMSKEGALESDRHNIETEKGSGVYYDLVKLSDEVYALTDTARTCVADLLYVKNQGKVTFKAGIDYPEKPGNDQLVDFAAAASAAVAEITAAAPVKEFAFGDKNYTVQKAASGGKVAYEIYCNVVKEDVEPNYYFVSSFLAPAFADEADFNKYGKDSAFKFNAFVALYTGETEFTYDGVTYATAFDENGSPMLKKGEEESVFFSQFVAARKDGGALSIDFIRELEEAIENMQSNATAVGTEVPFTADSPKVEQGKEVLDANGKKILVPTDYTIKREQNDYTIWRFDQTYVILIYDLPSADHWLGTDAHGMDVLARIMYGGRISLLVGFIVVFIEMFIGVIMGGIAGYFGGWVDNIIMRMVDVFYCIPSMPILIITGALFDSLHMDYITRLIWMMAILGLLGWAGVARLVRGQILSLREQEFMVAAEASGLSTRRRIFKHLVPNVMPQLIVQATMGLGGVIITESTLSFLGLGVKHPLATWGNMMNNITQKIEYLSAYAYIWVPIGCLICLAVIAFNFVGDGLRDAFDPKMKR